MKKSLLLTTCLVLAVAGCAEMDTKPAPAAAKPAASNSAELDAVIASAEKEIAAAKKMNSLWSKTEGFLEDAKKAKAEGKTDDAMKNAKKALKEAELAQKQAASETGKVHFPH